MSRRLRLLIADRQPTRVGIRLALEGELEVCGEANNAETAIRAAKREQPDLCLVGDDLAGSAITAVRGIFRAAPGAAIVVLCQTQDADLLLDYVRAGAVGYLPGALDPDRLRRVVHAVTANEAIVPRSMVLELVLELRGRGTLTTRESQVLGMLRRGHSTAEIAKRLEIAPVTVRRYVSELVQKLGVENRAGLTSPRPASSSNGSTPDATQHPAGSRSRAPLA